MLESASRADYNRLVAYIEEHCHCKVAKASQTPGGAALAAWVTRQRVAQTKGVLSAERSEQLGRLSFA